MTDIQFLVDEIFDAADMDRVPVHINPAKVPKYFRTLCGRFELDPRDFYVCSCDSMIDFVRIGGPKLLRAVRKKRWP